MCWERRKIEAHKFETFQRSTFLLQFNEFSCRSSRNLKCCFVVLTDDVSRLLENLSVFSRVAAKRSRVISKKAIFVMTDSVGCRLEAEPKQGFTETD